jgi:ankyrin repeat protein
VVIKNYQLFNNGNTALNIALIESNEIIITLLCSQPNIIPFIPNNENRTALDISDNFYRDIVRRTIGINYGELINKPWKGVTLDYIKKFDLYI